MRLRESFRAGVRPSERLTPVQWMAKNVVVPHSARNTQFDPATAPWMNEIIAEIAKDSNDEIVVCAPVGSGKTTLFEALLCWIISENPGPTLVAGQTDKTAKQWAESRLMPMFDAIPAVAKLFPQDRNSKRKTEILFKHMPLFIGGANLTSLQEKSIRWCIGDEVWRWVKGMVGEFKRRTHDRWNSRVILVSQGGEEGDDFHDEEDMCEKREFAWQCRCGDVHLWKLEDLKFEKVFTAKGALDWKATTSTVRLVCPTCKAEYRDEPQVRRALSATSRYIVTQSGAPGMVAFRYPALAVWWIPWSSLITEWIKATDESKRGVQDPLRQFIQKRLAKRWVEEGSRAKDEDVLRLRGEYKRGTLPIKPCMITFCTDTGEKETHWSACAWLPSGESFIIDYGTVLAPEDILPIAKSLQWTDPDGGVHGIHAGLMDSGFWAHRVYDVCKQLPGVLFPCKGSSSEFGAWSKSELRDDGGLFLYTFVDYQAKAALYLGKIAMRKAPFIWFPADSSDDFLRGHMGQRLVTPKGGKRRKEFAKVAGDHYGDCSKQHLVCWWILAKEFADDSE